MVCENVKKYSKINFFLSNCNLTLADLSFLCVQYSSNGQAVFLDISFNLSISLSVLQPASFMELYTIELYLVPSSVWSGFTGYKEEALSRQQGFRLVVVYSCMLQFVIVKYQ